MPNQISTSSCYVGGRRYVFALPSAYSATLTNNTRQNGDEPEIIEIEIENPSAFHPKDVPQLIKDYLSDTDRFQYYDSKKCIWYTGSNSTAPRNVNKLGDDDMCYWSDGVKWGKSMPGVQNKRPTPEESPAPKTPRRPL